MNYPRLYIRQAEKVSQEIGVGKNSNSPLYSKTKKSDIFWMKKMMLK